MAVTMRSAKNSKPKMAPTYFGKRVDTRNYLNQKLRVCAYCRVSTELEEQQSSFDTQIQFYKKYICENPNWELIEIYADDGKSGSQIYWRNGFSKMIEDARMGMFDLVLTKSFTRFARNTVDSIETVRLFSALGIDIYFEDKSLHSLDQKGEMMVTLYSAFAQEELRNLSANTAWGYQKSFERGEVLVTGLLGYRSKDRVVTVVEHEARTVRLIYRLFLEGCSYYRIKQELEARGLRAKRGNTTWSQSSIRNILLNEKYAGNALCQKTVCVDYLTHTRVKNQGHKKQYYVKNSHEAIVPNEVYLAVQAEIRRRELLSDEIKHKDPRTSVKESLGSGSNYSAKYYLSNVLFCENCGSPFRRYTWTSRGKKIMWMCRVRKQKGGREKCPHSPSIEENALHCTIMKALKIANLGLQDTNSEYADTNDSIDVFQKIIEFEDSLVILKKELSDLFETNGYSNRVDELETQISIAELNLSYYKYQVDKSGTLSSQMMKDKVDLSRYSDDLVKMYIDKILVNQKGTLTVKFKTGTEVKVTCDAAVLA